MAERLNRSLSPAFGQVVQGLATAAQDSTEEGRAPTWYNSLFVRVMNSVVQNIDEADGAVFGLLQAHSLWKHGKQRWTYQP